MNNTNTNPSNHQVHMTRLQNYFAKGAVLTQQPMNTNYKAVLDQPAPLGHTIGTDGNLWTVAQTYKVESTRKVRDGVNAVLRNTENPCDAFKLQVRLCNVNTMKKMYTK